MRPPWRKVLTGRRADLLDTQRAGPVFKNSFLFSAGPRGESISIEGRIQGLRLELFQIFAPPKIRMFKIYGEAFLPRQGHLALPTTGMRIVETKRQPWK